MQFLTEAKQKVAVLLEENSTTLLTAGGIVGTIATALLAGRAGWKMSDAFMAEQISQQVEDIGIVDPDTPLPKLDKWQKAKLSWPYLLPPVITGTATVGAIFMANRMSAQKAAALAAAYGLAERQLGEYKAKVAEKLTGPKKSAVEEELAQEAVDRTPGSSKIVFVEGEVLCFDKPTGRYFNSTVETIKQAVNSTNAEVFNHGFARASFFYDELGLGDTTWTDEVGFTAENLLELTFSTVLAPGNRPCVTIDFTRMPRTDYHPKYD